MPRNSGKFQMFRNFLCGSFPASSRTIKSVPPANGFQTPGSFAMRLERRCEIARRLHVVGREQRPHARVPECVSAWPECRTASTTDSKIFM